MEKVFFVGQMLIANYGAMYPIENGVIVGFNTLKSVNVAIVLWGSGERRIEHINIDTIHAPGETSPNGSSIGIYTI